MLNRRGFISGAIASSGLLPTLARAESRPTPSYPVLAGLTRGLMAERKIAGAAFAIGRHRYRADFMAWGYSALSRGQFLNEDSIFRIYSMTKPVTGAAAMLLIEDGKLKLDQNIADFLPGFAQPRVALDPARSLESRPAKGPITVRHLLTHTAGLTAASINGNFVARAYREMGLIPSLRNIATDPPRAPSLSAFADRLAMVPLIADPGVRWHYGVGLDLLGAVIERASGQPFDDFLKDRLFDPLDMDDTGFQVPQRKMPRFVANYLLTPKGLQPFDMPPDTIYALKPAFPFGGSGLVSTARDYSRFTAMLLGEGRYGSRRIMLPETAATMMSNLLPKGVEAPGGQGFGAGGQVLVRPVFTGQGIGTFSWAGVGGTMMWVDRAYQAHAVWLAQFMPIDALPVQYAVPRAVYEDLSKQ
ncbi:hypothetical protein BSL82_00340 [Tardibacter chloracetimidivorans]|uniref:Beta-lactamase-related domain-containing protein n=1 Tax=Tardibacter chloracetimidivorans TaxID=1921510 RepID=A0A1L3ZQN7_9SPHN|nr:serine hydrolase domain-containing protein [Tardibacter chloracetimidivorans]API57939.1 hypothetical protein BSL82_00340 [Tardibacter chloracetimidivorans]